MNFRIIIFLFCFAILNIQMSQAQEITLEKIHSGYYGVEGIKNIKSLKDGEYYTVLESSGIVKYSYKTSEKIENIVEGKFEDYIFSDDENKILLQLDNIPIYRRSFLGKFNVKNLKTGEIININNGNWVQEPKFSPDGEKVAFIVENNLFYQNLKTNEIIQITFDGKKNQIINGIGDWVYEEEFSHADFYQWNNASNAIVFVKFDESSVQEIDIPFYSKNLYPRYITYKYPKAGEKNSVVTAHIYQISNKKIININLEKFENYYIPKIFRTSSKYDVVLATSNRHQNKLDLIKINTNTGDIEKIFSEIDSSWIEIDNMMLEFMQDNSFIWASERDGFRHLYWYDSKGKLKKQLSNGNWEVTHYYGYNYKTKEIYIQTTKNGSLNRAIYKLNIQNGKMKLISFAEGHNGGAFSKDFKYFINSYSTSRIPTKYVLKDEEGKIIKELKNNDKLLNILKNDNFLYREFFTIPNNSGDQMNAWVIKPKDFDPTKKYPVFMYQYSGPGSQQVANSWSGRDGIWFSMLAQKGYIVVCVDGRGTGFRGTKYKKVIYKKLGEYEIQDQITAARWLANQWYVDETRIGIFGWSFGGYISSLAMTKGADVFKLGIAVAPVTNWRYYDTIYTERFLQTPQENPDGYDQNSPTTFANLLKGKFLLIHGMADDNVHFQNSVEFAESLIQSKKQFDFMVYPDKNHGIYGGNTRFQLYEKMTNFILNNL